MMVIVPPVPRLLPLFVIVVVFGPSKMRINVNKHHCCRYSSLVVVVVVIVAVFSQCLPFEKLVDFGDMVV